MAERSSHHSRGDGDAVRSNWSGVVCNSGRTDHLDPMEEGDLTPDWDETDLDNRNEREEEEIRRSIRQGGADEEMAGEDHHHTVHKGNAKTRQNSGREVGEYGHGTAKQISQPREMAPKSTKLNEIQSPVVNTGENISGGPAKIDAAGASGIFSDHVLTGSPAQEYGEQGRYTLKEMIAASDRIAREKYRATHEE